jgi:hypothetical protein
MKKFDLLLVLKFSVLLLVVRVALSALLTGIANYLAEAVLLSLIFAWLGSVQSKLAYLHALAVVVVHELLGIALLQALGADRSESPLWFVDWIIVIGAALLGAGIGRKLRARSG